MCKNVFACRPTRGWLPKPPGFPLTSRLQSFAFPRSGPCSPSTTHCSPNTRASSRPCVAPSRPSRSCTATSRTWCWRTVSRRSSSRGCRSRTSVPKATSLQLTVAVTTKLARLLQEQALREIAVNRIATAIRSSLELSSVLQTTVDEVGRALGAQHSALCVEGEPGEPPLMHCYFRDGEGDESEREGMVSDLHAYQVRLGARMKAYVQDGCAGAGPEATTRPVAAVPLIYRERAVGVLMVRSDDPARVWEENQILLMRTVADQVAVAVNHARLFEE